jgi:hypothetical protein
MSTKRENIIKLQRTINEKTIDFDNIYSTIEVMRSKCKEQGEKDVTFPIFYTTIHKAKISNSKDISAFIDMCSKLYSLTGDENYFYFRSDLMKDYVELSYRETGYTERNLRDDLIKNFNDIFPYYEYIQKEYVINSRFKIDIFAKEKQTDKSVIIEIKKKDINPNDQLIKYSNYFEYPILISISEEPIKQKLNNVKYFVVNYLN